MIANLGDVAPIIIAVATLVTAVGGVIAILLQNKRQHTANQAVGATKIDEAVGLLVDGQTALGAKLDAHLDRFDKHVGSEESTSKAIDNSLRGLRADNEVLFGMVVAVDSKVTTLANRGLRGDHFDELMAVGG